MPVPYPDDRLYHAAALWLKLLDDDEALVGINEFAQSSLGEVLFVDLPRVGAVIGFDTAFGTIESGKVVSDLVSPASGSVLVVNARLREEPGLVNLDPYGEGWLLRIRLHLPRETERLLDAATYQITLGQAAT